MPLYDVRVTIPMPARTPGEAEAYVRKGLGLVGKDYHVDEVIQRRFCVREYRDWYVNVRSTRDEEWSSVKRKALAETAEFRWPASHTEVTEVVNP